MAKGESASFTPYEMSMYAYYKRGYDEKMDALRRALVYSPVGRGGARVCKHKRTKHKRTKHKRTKHKRTKPSINGHAKNKIELDEKKYLKHKMRRKH